MPSHARTRSIGTAPHQGAQSARMPRRLSPRRTHKIMGLIRVTPRQHEGYLAGLAASILLVGISDLPTQLVDALIGG